MQRQRFGLLLILICCCLLVIMPVSAQAEGTTIKISAEDLATAVSQAQDGDTIEVTGGTYQGALIVDKSLTLIGKNWPIIDGEFDGSVVTLLQPHSSITGFVIKNSGDSLNEQNSGIAVQAEHILVENNRFEDTLFGIYLQKAHHSVVRNNTVTSKDLEVQRRGDPIRLWYSTDVLVEDNVVDKGRDVVLWYSERLTILNNTITNGRYGLHFMYCDDAIIENNSLRDNSVGTFMMYSRRVTLRNNTIANNRGPSGFGIGMKDMDDATIENNLILDNRVGVHLDTSPREVDSFGKYSGNVFAYNDIGVELMPSVRNNEFSGNSFVENEEQVGIAGGGIIRDNVWTVNGRGNYWSDYAGFDADGDGQGDIEYKSERLFENLMQNEPKLRLFIYSPASNAIDFASKAFPMVKPQPKLVDERPYMTPMIPPDAPPLPQASNQGWIWLALTLVIIALALAALPRINRRRYKITPPLSNSQKKFEKQP